MGRVCGLSIVLVLASGCGLMLDPDGQQADGADATMPDSRAPDGARPDVAPPDVAPTDMGMPDIGSADAMRSDAVAPDVGTADAGAPPTLCSVDGECAVGQHCFYIGWPPGVCTRDCSPSDDCGGNGAECNGPSCSPACDPITGSGCGGLACDFFDVGAPDITFCRFVGTARRGDPCDFTSGDAARNCQAADFCAGYGGGWYCMQKCRVDMVPSDCEASRSCLRLGVQIGTVEWGVCGPP